MAAKPRIAIVGPGRLGTVLALALRRAGYPLTEIVSRDQRASLQRARKLARQVHARAVTSRNTHLDAHLIWLCVPDRDIAAVARELAHITEWQGKVAFHSSGALPSDELSALRNRGAAVASVHPMMTFVRGSIPSLAGVPFALEGDIVALRLARQITRDLGGKAFVISKAKKVAYHSWGSFLSPLLVGLLLTSERVARAAGLSAADARKNMLLIVRQTLANYAKLGPAVALSGPIVRGDAATVRKHLDVLKKIPTARDVYLALARAALHDIPVHKRKELERVLRPPKA